MSRIILVDTSGGFSVNDIKPLKKIIRVGDRVIMFDHNVYDQGIMQSQNHIDSLKFMGGGGTLLAQALKYIGQNFLDPRVSIFTDGYIPDIQESKEIINEYDIVVKEVFAWSSAPTLVIDNFSKVILPA